VIEEIKSEEVSLLKSFMDGPTYSHQIYPQDNLPKFNIETLNKLVVRKKNVQLIHVDSKGEMKATKEPSKSNFSFKQDDLKKYLVDIL